MSSTYKNVACIKNIRKPLRNIFSNCECHEQTCEQKPERRQQKN